MKRIIFHVTILLAFFALLAACGSSPAAAETDAVAVVASVLTPPVSTIDELDESLREASTYFNGRIPEGSKVVFLNMRSDYPDLSEYILSILSENAVNDGRFSVVDRQQLDAIRAELDFQMSGEVSDESAQSIGRLLGAEGIVSGTINKIGPLYRVQVKAIEVETAGVQGQWSKNLSADGTLVTVLTERVVPASAANFAPSRIAQAQAPAVQAPSSSTTTTAVVAESPKAEETVAPPVKTNYAIGETGPAGGIIFYDKGNSSGGWRYLEAAPVETEFKSAAWAVNENRVDGTQREIGTGKKNTQLMIEVATRDGVDMPAARLCDRLNYGGYDDWFLPSIAELGLMYLNLKTDGLGGFSGEGYWSSTEYRSGTAWFQSFSNGRQYSDTIYDNDKDDSYSVRAIRQF